VANKSPVGKLLAGALAVLLLAGLGYEIARHRPRPLNTLQLGPVRAFPAWLHQRGFVYVFSGADGWSAADARVAGAYARAGNFVIGIDTPEFLKHVNRTAQGCVFMPGLLEDYSRAQQRDAGTTRFSGPVLLGRGVGATVVYIAQLQAPALAFSAAVAVDPEGQIALGLPLCDHPFAAPGVNGQQLKPEALGRNVSARVLLDARAKPVERAFVAAIGRLSGGEQAGAGMTTGVGVATSDSLRSTYAAALAAIDSERQRSGVADLPLVEVPAARPSGEAFAVFYSGDGGWRDLDRSLADVLAAKGMSVVGVDVLRYFWKDKPPRVAADDLARIIRYYQMRWQRRKVVLIGFSFGANVLPFLINRLPADAHGGISLVTLLSPERTAAFSVDPKGWLGVQSSTGTPIEPELRLLPKLHLQCIYGADEATASLCTTPAAAGYDSVRKNGGHHFDRDYGGLANEILAAAR